tara:strand:- start:4333 stop:5178 length:846 start_codon:yes stop_codon:yes gene_type:complete
MSDIFNNRELAILIWLTLILILLSFKKGILKSYFDLLLAFFQDKIISSVLISIIYVELIILLLAIVNYWEMDLLKDTTFWYIGTAFLLMLNSNKALENKTHFKKIFWNSFKLIVVLEFITNFYTFDLLWELVLIPIVSFIAILDAFAEQKNEHKPVKKLTQAILTIIGIIIFVYSAKKIITNSNEFLNVNSAQILLLPIILTLLFLPFLYFYVLYMKYENIYCRIGFRFKNKDKDFLNIKKRIFQECKLNLRKLERLEKTNSFHHILDYSDLEKTIKELNR